MILPLLLTLPWVITARVWAQAVANKPKPLPSASDARALLPASPPLVSVIIPARNEAHNIERVLGSVLASTYPRFEVIVVDDNSADGTGELARRMPVGNAERVEVVRGQPLPPDWLGKSWACAQGAQHSRGDLLLFTDADTTHGPDLLTRSVAGSIQGGDLVTVFGQQILGSFWERLVMPQIFAGVLSRFAHVKGGFERKQWRAAIANGQYLLFRRDAYEALGGHEAVKAEIVEDLRLSQIVVRGGWKLTILLGEDALSTRMYRNLPELVAGWSKNMATSARQSMPRKLQGIILPLLVIHLTILWIVPPMLLAASLLGVGGGGLRLWACITVAISALLWGSVTHTVGGPRVYGALYPLGAIVNIWILIRSWQRGTRVEWKGRSLVTPDVVPES